MELPLGDHSFRRNSVLSVGQRTAFNQKENHVILRFLFAAPLLFCSATLFAQQGPPPTQDHGQTRMHHPGDDRADVERSADEREQMRNEMQDLDELGLPPGQFWLNPDLVAAISLTPDQVHRLAETYLQGRLKLIQLDAALQTEEAKLEPMLAAPVIDNDLALAQTDRIAEARAALDKADAHMAFALRAILKADQLTRLRTGLHGQQTAAAGPRQ